MSRKLVGLVAGLICLKLSPVVNAVPMLLSETEFAAATLGTTPVVEDFEGFAVGNLTSPVTLANATYTSVLPQIRQDAPNNPTKRLFENAPDPVGGRVFSSFPTDTMLFGTDLAPLSDFALQQILDISVLGVSGALDIQLSFLELNEFFAVSDPLDLISISFENIGFGGARTAWGFDNVTTAAIPEPTTLALLSLGLAGKGFARNKKLS